jgi:hypothetical protein
MKKAVSAIIKDVRIAIDEIALNDADFAGGEDNQELDSIICSKIKEAVDFVHGNAAYSIIDISDNSSTEGSGTEGSGKSNTEDSGKSSDGGSVKCKEATSTERADFVYVIQKPTDFHRFLYGMMDCWGELVLETIDVGTEDYALALDPVVGATPNRPAIAYDGLNFMFIKGAGKGTGKGTDKGTDKDEDTASLYYLPICGYDHTTDSTTEEITINNSLYTALIYQLAGLTLLTLGEQSADNMFNLAMTHMGINGRKE